MAKLEDVLEKAVERAINDPPPAIRTAAEGICRLNGPRPGCWCGKGKWSRCHAVELYGDLATAAVMALREEGIIPRPPASREIAPRRPGSQVEQIAAPAP